MAKVEINAITEHFRGKVGDVIFKRRLGILIAALRPKASRLPPTVSQIGQRLEFAKAVSYARSAIENPATRVAYEQAGLTKHMGAFATAVGDYFKPPVVQDIDTSGYQGQAGGKIVVMAVDDIEVMSVHVTLRAASGSVLEQGPATLAFNKWTYTATTTPPAGQPVTIEVTSKDRPGHEGMQTKVYP